MWSLTGIYTSVPGKHSQSRLHNSRKIFFYLPMTSTRFPNTLSLLPMLAGWSSPGSARLSRRLPARPRGPSAASSPSCKRSGSTQRAQRTPHPQPRAQGNLCFVWALRVLIFSMCVFGFLAANVPINPGLPWMGAREGAGGPSFCSVAGSWADGTVLLESVQMLARRQALAPAREPCAVETNLTC